MAHSLSTTTAVSPCSRVRDQKLSVDKIVEEVPIVVHSSLLTTALVNELQEDPSIRSRSVGFV